MSISMSTSILKSKSKPVEAVGLEDQLQSGSPPGRDARDQPGSGVRKRMRDQDADMGPSGTNGTSPLPVPSSETKTDTDEALKALFEFC